MLMKQWAIFYLQVLYKIVDIHTAAQGIVSTQHDFVPVFFFQHFLSNLFMAHNPWHYNDTSTVIFCLPTFNPPRGVGTAFDRFYDWPPPEQ